VIIVPFVDGRPAGGPEDVLTGFVDDRAGTRSGGRLVSRLTERCGFTRGSTRWP
jgi:hypothetical protein